MIKAKLRTLVDIYAQVPSVNCKGLCSAGCTRIPLYPAEVNAIQKAGLEVPSFDEITGCCSALVEGRCSIYEHRPLICRLYGNVKPNMVCQFGCKPTTVYLTDKQSRKLFDALAKLSGTTGGGAVIPRKGGVLLKEPEISLKQDVIQKIIREEMEKN